MAWTDEREEIVKTMWEGGYSGSQIANRLGVTRNSVIGKVHRLGLSGRTVTHRKATAKMSAKRYRRSPNALTFGKVRSRVPIPTEPIPPPHETDIPRVSFMDLEDSQCKFICGEPKGPYEKQFCGEPRVEGLPYCVVHAQRCYGPPRPGNAYPQGRHYAGTKRDGHRLDAVQEFAESN